MSLNPGLVLQPSASLREAMEAITKNGRQMVTVVDVDGRLAGIVTDGDARRGILRGATLDGPVTEVMNAHPVVGASALTREEAVALMQRRALRYLPLLDAERRLAAVLFLDDLLRRAPLPNAAVIMAGGFGRRLGDLTKGTPKPLLEIGGKPLLEIMIEWLRTCGFAEIWLVLNYKAHMIDKYFRDNRPADVDLRYDYDEGPGEDRSRGTAGKLGDFVGRLSEPFLVVNGDILTKCNFREMLDFHKRHAAAITIGTVPYTVEVPFGVLDLKGEQVIAVEEKPRRPVQINAGVYVIDPEVLLQIKPWDYLDMPELIERAMKSPYIQRHGHGMPLRQPSKVVAFPIREYWLDIGRPDDLERARRDVAEGLLD